MAVDTPAPPKHTHIEGKSVAQIGAAKEGGEGPGEFREPTGITSDAKNIYVCDCNNSRVQIFDKKTLSFVDSFGSKGDGKEEFNCPYFIAHDSGELWITDLENSRVQIYSTEGKVKRSIRTGFKPYGIALWRNLFYVANFSAHSVHVYSKAGKSLGVWKNEGGGRVALLNPFDIHCTENGHIYVTDSGNHRVVVFNKEGVCLALIGKGGTGPEDLDDASAVAVQGGYVYIGDDNKKVIQVYKQKGGEYVATLKQEAEISYIRQMMFDQGQLYYCDMMNWRVQILK